jgi:preprotein translocase subunit SecE
MRGILKKIISFLREVKIETKKVNWPSKKETFRYTLIVIFVSLLVAAFLGTLDYLFANFLRKIIR